MYIPCTIPMQMKWQWQAQNSTLSEQFQYPIETSEKEVKSIPLRHKYMTGLIVVDMVWGANMIPIIRLLVIDSVFTLLLTNETLDQ